MPAPNSPLLRIGKIVTRVMLSPPLRRFALAQRAYATLYLTGKWLAERREREFFRQHLTPGMVVLDIGANVGFYTTLFSRLVGEAGHVYALEPDPFSFDILARRVRRPRFRNVTTDQLALGDREGTTTLFCSMVNRADNRTHPSHEGVPVERVVVPLTTLDAFCARRGIDRIDVVKMDVQGAEVAVFHGMRRTVERCRPQWMFLEFAPADLRGAGTSPEEFWGVLQGYGYTPYALDERCRPLPIADRALFTQQHADWYTNVWAHLNRRS